MPPNAATFDGSAGIAPFPGNSGAWRKCSRRRPDRAGSCGAGAATRATTHPGAGRTFLWSNQMYPLQRGPPMIDGQRVVGEPASSPGNKLPSKLHRDMPWASTASDRYVNPACQTVNSDHGRAWPTVRTPIIVASMSAPSLTVYTDHKSPYAFLAKDRVYTLAAETGATIDW